jgi:2-polyprenyl-6-hydroxyphenyl methylase/3-demethylubiquinone-9 3-methyltransferase
MSSAADPTARSDASVDAEEVAKFAALAEEWWDPAGKFRPLHRFNPTRLGFIRDRVAAHYGRDPLGRRGPLNRRPLEDLSMLDIGCGGGLLAEPLTRLGARITAIDAAERSVKIATQHAREAGLAIDYRHATAEQLAEAGETYDVVLNMEIVEHLADVAAFFRASCALVKPGGLMVVATLNRTPKAFLMAIVGAEYVLGWLPRGSHDWQRFLRPSELAKELRANAMEVSELTGVSYNPLADTWHLSRDLGVNYMVLAVKG